MITVTLPTNRSRDLLLAGRVIAVDDCGHGGCKNDLCVTVLTTNKRGGVHSMNFDASQLEVRSAPARTVVDVKFEDAFSEDDDVYVLAEELTEAGDLVVELDDGETRYSRDAVKSLTLTIHNKGTKR